MKKVDKKESKGGKGVISDANFFFIFSLTFFLKQSIKERIFIIHIQ